VDDDPGMAETLIFILETEGYLVTVAENYEIEAEDRTRRVISMIEPVMTIAMGLAVGFLALSIFMPLYSSLTLLK